MLADEAFRTKLSARRLRIAIPIGQTLRHFRIGLFHDLMAEVMPPRTAAGSVGGSVGPPVVASNPSSFTMSPAFEGQILYLVFYLGSTLYRTGINDIQYNRMCWEPCTLFFFIFFLAPESDACQTQAFETFTFTALC